MEARHDGSDGKRCPPAFDLSLTCSRVLVVFQAVHSLSMTVSDMGQSNASSAMTLEASGPIGPESKAIGGRSTGAESVELAVGSAEFLGPNEERGWGLVGAAIPLLYIAWSLWLLAIGVALIA
jgi:hypothetical protein